MQEVRIKIPKAKDDEIVNIPKGTLGDLKSHFDRQFNKIDKLLFAIVTSVVVSVVAVLISALGLFVDQMRYNNAAYTEYSEKTQSVEDTLKTNNELLDQNQKNQATIVELVKEVQILIQK